MLKRCLIFSAITAAALSAPLTASAAVVTVWDTFDGTPIGSGMTIGSDSGFFQGVKFVPTATGYFSGFDFGAYQPEGTTDWQLTLHADAAGIPGAVLETLPPIDVPPGSTVGVYTGTANVTTLLSSGVSYWLMAYLPTGEFGSWSRIESGTGTRAFCAASDCPSYTVLTDEFAGALEVRVDTSPVPLPAAAWLLLSGIGGLAAVARRRRGAPGLARHL